MERVFTEHQDAAEGRTVRRLVEEIRSKQYYLPELAMTHGQDENIGYAMFSRFHIEGRYEEELLILTPVTVKTELQQQHISGKLVEYSYEKVKKGLSGSAGRRRALELPCPGL